LINAIQLNEQEVTFWNLDTIKLDEFRPGILSKVEIDDNLLMVCMEIDPDKEDTSHANAHDQCVLVLAGQILMFIGEDCRVINSN
jgi:hypothetical protein